MGGVGGEFLGFLAGGIILRFLLLKLVKGKFGSETKVVDFRNIQVNHINVITGEAL